MVAWSAAWKSYLSLRAEVAGLDYLLASLILLPVALVVSLAKAGLLARWMNRPRTQ